MVMCVIQLRILWILEFFQGGCKVIKLHLFGCSTGAVFGIWVLAGGGC